MSEREKEEVQKDVRPSLFGECLFVCVCECESTSGLVFSLFVLAVKQILEREGSESSASCFAPLLCSHWEREK